MTFKKGLEKRLLERKQDNLFRKRKVLNSAQSQVVSLQSDSKQYLNFCSNDYLGLANHPSLISSFQDAAKNFGVGSGASHLVIGHHQEHYLLEQELAAFVGAERALVFGSGFSANLGILTTLLGKQDTVFHDKLNHASLLDGSLASGARFQRYLHNDMESLEKKLLSSNKLASKKLTNQTETGQKEVNKLIVSDAVFSMDGDSADIPALLKKSQQHDAWLMLDDAHGFGVLGEQGRGSVNSQNVAPENVDIYMATFGKALGTSGAFVAGSELLIESLIQFCRHYIYSTAMPPAIAAATRTALDLVKDEDWRREKLKNNIEQFRASLKHLNLMESNTAIQPIILGDAQRAINWSEQLAARGILVSAIRPPTVAKNSARLRVTLSAQHSEEQIRKLINALIEINANEKV